MPLGVAACASLLELDEVNSFLASINLPVHLEHAGFQSWRTCARGRVSAANGCSSFVWHDCILVLALWVMPATCALLYGALSCRVVAGFGVHPLCTASSFAVTRPRRVAPSSPGTHPPGHAWVREVGVCVAKDRRPNTETRESAHTHTHTRVDARARLLIGVCVVGGDAKVRKCAQKGAQTMRGCART